MVVVPVVAVPAAVPMVPGLVTHAGPTHEVWVMPSGGNQGWGNVEHPYHQGFGAHAVQGGQIPIRDFHFHIDAAEAYGNQAKGAQAYCAHIMVGILENLEQLPTCKPLSRKLRDKVVRLVWTMEPRAVEALLQQHRKPLRMGQVLDLLTKSGHTKSQLLGAARKALMSMADQGVSVTPTPLVTLEEIQEELPAHLWPAIQDCRDYQAEVMRLMGLAMDHGLLAKQQSWTWRQTERADRLIKSISDGGFRCVWVFMAGVNPLYFKSFIKSFMSEAASSRIMNHMWVSYDQKKKLFGKAAEEEKKKMAEKIEKRKLANSEPSSSNEDALDSEDSLAETTSVVTEDGGFDTEGDLESKGDEEEGGTMESLKVETKEEDETKCRAKTEDVTGMAVIQPKGEDASMPGEGEQVKEKMDLIAPPPAQKKEDEKVDWYDLDDDTPFPTTWKWTEEDDEEGDCSSVSIF